MPAVADAGQIVVASIMGLGAAGVAGGVVAMAWSLHLHQLQLAGRAARRAAGEEREAESAVPAQAVSGTVNRNGAAKVAERVKAAVGNSVLFETGAEPPAPPAAEPPSLAPPTAIEGPDRVLIGEQARYRVRRTGGQQVVAWAAGGGAVSQASDPAHPGDLLLVADRPGNLTLSVRLREGLAERRETKTVTVVPNPEASVPAVATRMLLQDWPVITVAVLVVGFAAALTAVGSLPVGDFIALVAPLTAVLAVVAATRGPAGRPGR